MTGLYGFCYLIYFVDHTLSKCLYRPRMLKMQHGSHLIDQACGNDALEKHASMSNNMLVLQSDKNQPVRCVNRLIFLDQNRSSVIYIIYMHPQSFKVNC